MRTVARLFQIIGILAVLGLAGYGVYAWWHEHVRPYESTDNAYVRAHMAQISPQVTGYVKAVHFNDNEVVEAGTLLIEIDDAPLRAKRDQAAAEVAARALTRSTLEAELKVQASRIAQAAATMSAANAGASRARKDLDRLHGLVEDGSITGQSRDAAEAALSVATANVSEAHAHADEATNTRAKLTAEIAEADAAHAVAQAALHAADVDLEHTRIVAPISGQLGNRSVQVGQLVQPGLALAFLIPRNDYFVEANFKETQIEHMRPGQRVKVEIDAYPDTTFTGVIDSTAPASGAEFSILPPENATGNFTKIVRRVPVKIRFDDGDQLALLKPGLSCVVKVRVD